MNKTELFEQRKGAIREMIHDENYIPLKFKEMAYLMGVPQEDKKELKEVLDALLEDGSVELTSKGKYIKPENQNVTGTFVGNMKGFGFVTVEGEEEDIFIPAEYVNGAFHKDTVRVKIRKGEKPGKRREGCILKILERGCKSLVGTFHKNTSFGFVVPDDAHFGKDVFISKKKCGGAQQDDKVVVSLLSYGSDKKKPEGEVIEVLGNIDDPSTDVSSILKNYDIVEEFPKAVLKEVSHIDSFVPEDACKGRMDLRDTLTVTIDGEDARDLDDAITICKEGNGYRLGVHIADVTNYVTEGSALDTEAIARGTSVYLVDRVVPMLPRELSNGICSLNAGVDRLALSCIMSIDAQGNVMDHTIAETVIRVDQRMSYTGVQAILDGREHTEGKREDIVEMCYLMKEAAAVLKEKRRKRGSIDFDFPESKILLDENGYPSAIYPYERNTATDIIEDFMLLANETVAQDFFWQEIPFLYRVHEAPDADRIKKLDVFIHNFGYYLKTGRETFHPKEIQKLLFSLEGEPEEMLISRLALRSMQRAKYSTMNIGHFGLSTQYYSHFTSPIRRYPDLQIHRIIKENLHGKLNMKRIDHYEQLLPGIAESSSRLERRAQDAERDVEKLKKVEFMQNHLGESFQGVISSVTSWGFFVELDNTVEGLVSMQSLLDDYYIFDENQYKLFGNDYGREFTLGQKVEIVVDRVDKATRTIDFILKEFTEFDEDVDFMDENGGFEDEEWYEVVDEDGDSTIFQGKWDEEGGDAAINDWIDDDEVKRLLNLYK
ncbi:MAG: ribonuclease R [Eubacteriales bacterium]|nr:ribonuclease R [Eubacteriales bacterium]